MVLTISNLHLLARAVPARLVIFKLKPVQTSWLLKVFLDEHGMWVYKIKQDTAHIHGISVSETVMELGIGNLRLLPRAVRAHWGIRQL